MCMHNVFIVVHRDSLRTIAPAGQPPHLVDEDCTGRDKLIFRHRAAGLSLGRLSIQTGDHLMLHILKSPCRPWSIPRPGYAHARA